MSRRVVADFSELDADCSLTVSGDEEEVLDVVIRHAIMEHNLPYSEKLRDEIKSTLKEESQAEA